MNEIQSTGNE
jgi:hypothetical protein